MKWLHSACYAEDFVSEWQAREDAIDLAVACEFPCGDGFVKLGQFPGKKPQCGRLKVSFAEELEA